jgi:hypothetical protein
MALAAVFVGARTMQADVTGYGPLADWNSLALSMQGQQSGMFSSVDPGGNTLSDYSNYAGFDSTTGLNVIGQINGPGELTRFWAPHLSANGAETVEIFLDGSTTPTIVTDTASFLVNQSYGSGPQFRSPLVSTLIGGAVNYDPITFQQSAKIEIGNVGFYQVNYLALPGSTVIPTYSGTLNASQATARSTAVNMLTNLGANPTGSTPPGSQSINSVSIGANQSVTIASLTGGGEIGALKIQMPTGTPPTDAQLDGLRLRISYDGNSAYSVDAPISQFFGTGHGRSAYQSLPMGTSSSGAYYCYFPMPFRSGATVQLYNSTESSVPVTSAVVQFTPLASVPANAQYFHAVYQSQTTTQGQTAYNMLHITGTGHYVGNIMSVQSSNEYTMEGNDIITVDGSHVQEGTGMEDAYNGGYYYNGIGSPFSVSDHGDTPNATSGALPFSGLLSFPSFGTSTQYRWMINDAVPFTSSLDVSMQNYGGLSGVDWASTAFYYSDSNVPEPSTAALTLIATATGLLRRRRRNHVVSNVAGCDR